MIDFEKLISKCPVCNTVDDVLYSPFTGEVYCDTCNKVYEVD